MRTGLEPVPTSLIYNARECFILKFFEKCEGRSNFLGIFNALENLEEGFFKKWNK